MPFQIPSNFGPNVQNFGYRHQQSNQQSNQQISTQHQPTPYYYQDLQQRALPSDPYFGSRPVTNHRSRSGHVTPTNGSVANHRSLSGHATPTNGHVVETKYLLQRNGPMGSSSQSNAAANFFAKAHQRLQHSQNVNNNNSQVKTNLQKRIFK